MTRASMSRRPSRFLLRRRHDEKGHRKREERRKCDGNEAQGGRRSQQGSRLHCRASGAKACAQQEWYAQQLSLMSQSSEELRAHSWQLEQYAQHAALYIQHALLEAQQAQSLAAEHKRQVEAAQQELGALRAKNAQEMRRVAELRRLLVERERDSDALRARNASLVSENERLRCVRKHLDDCDERARRDGRL